MNEKSIAYCGLVCSFCCPDGKCSCKSENNYGKRLSQEGCYQYHCCTSKGIDGCWECCDAPLSGVSKKMECKSLFVA